MILPYTHSISYDTLIVSGMTETNDRESKGYTGLSQYSTCSSACKYDKMSHSKICRAFC